MAWFCYCYCEKDKAVYICLSVHQSMTPFWLPHCGWVQCWLRRVISGHVHYIKCFPIVAGSSVGFVGLFPDMRLTSNVSPLWLGPVLASSGYFRSCTLHQTFPHCGWVQWRLRRVISGHALYIKWYWISSRIWFQSVMYKKQSIMWRLFSLQVSKDEWERNYSGNKRIFLLNWNTLSVTFPQEALPSQVPLVRKYFQTLSFSSPFYSCNKIHGLWK